MHQDDLSSVHALKSRPYELLALLWRFSRWWSSSCFFLHRRWFFLHRRPDLPQNCHPAMRRVGFFCLELHCMVSRIWMIFRFFPAPPIIIFSSMVAIRKSQSCPRKLEIKADQLGIWRTASRLVPAPPVFANDFRHHEGKKQVFATVATFARVEMDTKSNANSMLNSFGNPIWCQYWSMGLCGCSPHWEGRSVEL